MTTTSRMIEVPAKGAQLSCIIEGRGPTCLVPSNMGPAPYQRQMRALTEALTLVHVDLRGSGSSTGAASDLDFDVVADDFEAVRRQLDLPQVAVLGHSVLGVLAMEYARRCPDRVSHVIAVGTPPFADMARLQTAGTEFFAANASPERKQRLGENMARLTTSSSMSEAMFAQSPLRFFDATVDARPLFEGAIARPEILQQLLGPLTAGWRVTPQTATPPVPTLIALGRHDYVSPWVLWREVAPTLPGTTVEIFERSGHQPFAEEPERFREVVTTWMGRARGGVDTAP